MTLELGPGLLAFLATLVTTVAGFFVLFMNQKAEFRKVDEARIELAKQTAVVESKKDETLKEIHVAVNSNMEKALAEIAQLKRIVSDLSSSANATVSQAATEAAAALKK